jgi:hypothetical protein
VSELTYRERRALELLPKARAKRDQLAAQNPTLRFAVARDGSAVGLWLDDQEKFHEVLMYAITDQWVWLVDDKGVIHSTLANGQPLYGPEDWIE